MVSLAALALVVAVVAPGARGVTASEHASTNTRKFVPGLGGGARFASLQAGGAYPSGDADITMREGLGENLPFPGSDYLGMGYNAVYGNPDGDGEKMQDPGWRGPVLRIHWCQNAECLSSDMQYLRPTNQAGEPIGWAHREVACEMSKKVSTQEKMSDYSRSLQADASVEAEGSLFGTGAAFSASAGYADFRQEVEEESMTRYQIKSYCTQFTMGLLKKKHDDILDPIFEKVAQGLGDPSEAAEQEKWFYLFDTMGTHVAIDIDLGGKMVMTSSVSDISRTTSSTTDIAAAVSASFEGAVYGGEVSLKTSASKAAMDSFRRSNKKSNVAVFGGLPPADNPVGSTQGFGEWAASVPERPMPVKYRLCRLDHCAGLNSQHYRAAMLDYAEERSSNSSGGVKRAKITLPFPLPLPRATWQGGDRLMCGQRLYPGEFLFSENAEYRAGFDRTLNFLVWKRHFDNRWVAVWQTRTGNETSTVHNNDKMTWNCKKRSSNVYAILGDQCIFNIMSHNHRFWSSHNGNKHAVCQEGRSGALILANDGHLYLVTNAGRGRWRSLHDMKESAARGEYWEYENARKDKGLGERVSQGGCKDFDDNDWRWAQTSPESC